MMTSIEPEGCPDWEGSMRGAEEIVAGDIRQSAITSHSIGVAELSTLLGALPAHVDGEAFRHAVVRDNVLGLATETGRTWRFKTLRRLYQFRPDSVLFRALRDLWPLEASGQPLLAALCALATDTVFRVTEQAITTTSLGDVVRTADFAERVEEAFPGAYAESTMAKVASNAYASWQQTGHLGPAHGGSKLRIRATCTASDVAYALLLGHLEGHRGEALFDTVWARVLDHPRSHLDDLAFAASQRGMIEFRNAGGVVEVGFRELLRPMESQLL